MNNLSTPEILQIHYNNTGIVDYPKTKLGLPDMRTRYNNAQWILYQKQKRKKQKEKEAKQQLKKTFQDICDEPCAICYEPKMYSHATLKCNHSYCLDCFVSHCRSNHQCPLCRNEFAPKVIKPMVAPNEYKDAILYTALEIQKHDIDGKSYKLYEYIDTKLEVYSKSKANDKNSSDNERTDIFNDIMDVIHATLIHSIRATCKYYDTQIEECG